MGIKLGKVFLKERKRLNLSQSEFIKHVISVSQYSRIENGEQDLRASDFLQLIIVNDLDINLFLKVFQDKRKANQEILQILAQAFYDRDLLQVKKIRDTLYNENYDNSLLIRAELIISLLENKDVSKNQNFEKKFTDAINKSNNWMEDKVFLQLFGSSMLIFDMNRLNFFMSQILKKYSTKIKNASFEEQRRIAGICINYLNRSYIEKDYSLIAESVKLLNDLAQNPDLLMYKVLGKYFKYLFCGEKAKKDNILHILEDSGYEKFIFNLVK